ncbi:aspartate:proton symporter, partial [Escherichia coli]
VLSYAIAPVTAAGLRRNAPDLPRPFRVRAFGIIGPVSFVISALIVFWSGWGTLSWLLGLQIVMFVVYVLCKSKVPVHTVSLAQQVKSSLWLIAFYALIMLFSWLGSFGGTGVIGHPWDTVVVAVMSLGIYYWGERTCLPRANFTGDEEE